LTMVVVFHRMTTSLAVEGGAPQPVRKTARVRSAET
jgi:hypothetical protein